MKLATKPIRDPIHNYIELTPIEQTMVDRPEFQRLRFILQNSSAYLTYPNNLNMRFLHSLGAMHLSSQMCRRAFEQASSADLLAYLQKVDVLVKKLAREMQEDLSHIETGWKTLVGNASRFTHQPLVGEPTANLDDHDLFLINTLWQSVRLCAVIHDIGHLPMSHVFENALDTFHQAVTCEGKEAFIEEYSARAAEFADSLEGDLRTEFLGTRGRAALIKLETIPLHEWWGFRIFRDIYPGDQTTWDSNSIRFCRLVYRISKLLFLVNRPDRPAGAGKNGDKYATLRCLHTIVSSELDADRLDYTVRDAMASGLEFGAIDVSRILNSLVLVRANRSFWVAPRQKAISAVESFFHQRYLLYQYMIYHHNVVRMDSVVEEIIVSFLRHAVAPKPASPLLQEVLDRFGFWRQEGVERFRGTAGPQKQKQRFHFMAHARWEHYDDAWLRGLMAEARSSLLAKKKNKARGLSDEGLTPEEGKILLLLETFLYRRSENLVSLWKLQATFVDALEEVANLTGNMDRDAVTRILREAAEAKARSAMLNELIEPLREKLLNEQHVILLYRHLPPRILKSRAGPRGFQLLKDGGEFVSAERASPYLKSLDFVGMDSAFFHFSLLAERIKDNKKKIEACRKIVLQSLADYVIDKRGWVPADRAAQGGRKTPRRGKTSRARRQPKKRKGRTRPDN